MSRCRPALAASVSLLVSACATQSAAGISRAADAPGFLLGLWHGFIFPVAWLLSHRIMVMKEGRVIEQGLTDRVLDDPREPYTQLLVSSIPQA